MGDLTQNISRYEIECKCGECKFDTIDYQVVVIWQDVCDYFLALKRGVKAVLNISSGCRCVKHNREENGHPGSFHLSAKGIDGNLSIALSDNSMVEIEPSDIAKYVNSKYPSSLGIGIYDGFTHIDSQPKRKRW